MCVRAGLTCVCVARAPQAIGVVNPKKIKETGAYLDALRTLAQFEDSPLPKVCVCVGGGGSTRLAAALAPEASHRARAGFP